MRGKFKLLILIILLVAIAVISIKYRDQFNLMGIRTWLEQYQPWTPIIFIALYITATVFFLPGSVLTIAGGLLFGAWWGTLYNIIGATIGATIAFIIARYIASDWVRAKGGKYLNKILDGVEHEGWRFIAFVRLVPLFPFNLLNYLLGLTKIGVVPYMLASFVFMLPGTFAYTYAGSLGETFVNSSGMELIGKILIGIGLLVLVTVLPIFIKRYRARH